MKIFISLITTLCLLGQAQLAVSKPGAKIISLSGEVKVRRGVNETWQPARIGMLLEDIDSILTGEASTVLLQTQQGNHFKLGGNAILDIADLRRITRKELFLYLMSEKVHRIEPRKEKTPLRIGNVSVVHGVRPETRKANRAVLGGQFDSWRREVNGAKALLSQKLYPNTILKLRRIREKYAHVRDCGESQLYLGQAFEALEMHGQALDAYQAVLAEINAQGCEKPQARSRQHDARNAIDKLKQER